MNLILSTGCNQSYFQKPLFKNYIESIKINSKADSNVIFTVDFTPEAEENLTFCEVSSKKISVPNSNYCLQHGSFLEGTHHHFNDEDIIIFTDGDIILQRWFDDKEIDWLKNTSKHEVIAGYNMSCYNTAKKSIEHLGMEQKNFSACEDIFEIPLAEIPDYNTGVVIAKVSMWKKLLQDYNHLAPKILPLIPGYWGQQFVLNASIARNSYHKRLPYEIHTHSHHINQKDFGMPVLPQLIDGKICYRKKVVVFAHHFFGFDNIITK